MIKIISDSASTDSNSASTAIDSASTDIDSTSTDSEKGQSDRVLNLIISNPDITLNELAVECGLSVRTVSRKISLLKKQGIIPDEKKSKNKSRKINL